MVIDFSELKRAAAAVTEKLDHTFLNDIKPFDETEPSAENIAAFIFHEIAREICETVGIPPVIHMGSCVDNSRVLRALCEMVKEGGLGADISDLPVAAAAPEAMSEKAISIGCYAVGSGVFTVFSPPPRVEGSRNVVEFLTRGIEEVTGGKFCFERDPVKGAEAMIAHMDAKRKALGLAPMMYKEKK